MNRKRTSRWTLLVGIRQREMFMFFETAYRYTLVFLQSHSFTVIKDVKSLKQRQKKVPRLTASNWNFHFRSWSPMPEWQRSRLSLNNTNTFRMARHTPNTGTIIGILKKTIGWNAYNFLTKIVRELWSLSFERRDL
jgi:hypothetical protein